MLINQAGQVFVGKRIDNKDSGAWQMPQGGIDPGEEPADAALRELAEETGVRAELCTLVACMDETVRYDLPEELVGKLWGGKYRGQEQTWFLARFDGEDVDIDLEAHDPPEFCEWQWLSPQEVPALIVPFKREVYEQVVAAFVD
ncbi:RNA pyrophosphohydrolase [Erythrobacter sp. W53]